MRWKTLKSSVELRGTLDALKNWYNGGIVASICISLFKSPSISWNHGWWTHFFHLSGTNWDWWEQQCLQPPCNLLWCKSLFLCWWGPFSTVSRKISGEARTPMGASQLIKPTSLIYPGEQIHDRLLPARLSRLAQKSVCSVLVGLNPWRQAVDHIPSMIWQRMITLYLIMLWGPVVEDVKILYFSSDTTV